MPYDGLKTVFKFACQHLLLSLPGLIVTLLQAVQATLLLWVQPAAVQVWQHWWWMLHTESLLRGTSLASRFNCHWSALAQLPVWHQPG